MIIIVIICYQHHHHFCQFQSCGWGTICIQNLANHHIYHRNDDNDVGDDGNYSASMMTFVMLFINHGDAVVIFQSVSLLSNWMTQYKNETMSEAPECSAEGLWDKVLYSVSHCGDIFSVWECSLRVARGCWCCWQWPRRWPWASPPVSERWTIGSLSVNNRREQSKQKVFSSFSHSSLPIVRPLVVISPKKGHDSIESQRPVFNIWSWLDHKVPLLSKDTSFKWRGEFSSCSPAADMWGLQQKGVSQRSTAAHRMCAEPRPPGSAWEAGGQNLLPSLHAISCATHVSKCTKYLPSRTEFGSPQQRNVESSSFFSALPQFFKSWL